MVCSKLSDEDSASILRALHSRELTDLFMATYKENAKRKR